jgi:hypothetical protein
MKCRHRVALLLPGLMMTLVVSARSEDFYETRLRDGQAAFREKLFVQAVDELRIASFGFLDRPVLLSESLARLSLAQAAAGQSAETDATLLRFLELERRFRPYAQVQLEPEIRKEFELLLSHRVSASTLLLLPALTGLVETEEQKITKLPSKERRNALETAFRREPGNVVWPLALARDAAQRQDWKDVSRWAEKALELDRANAQALALRAHARAERGDCAGALTDLAALPPGEWTAHPELQADRFVCLVESGDWARAEETFKLIPGNLLSRSDVDRAQQKMAAERRRSREGAAAASTKVPTQAEKTASSGSPGAPPAGTTQKKTEPSAGESAERTKKALAESRRLVSSGDPGDADRVLTEALKADPNNRDLHLAMLEVACLSRSYKKGAAQVPLVAPFTDTEAPSMFYAAVVLYETGRSGEARGYLERALPRVSGPLVDEYAKRILGNP